MTYDVLDPRRIPPSWRLPAVLYVVLEAALAGAAFSGDQPHPRLEITAFVLALPAMVVAIPFVYVLGAAAWDVRDQLAGQPGWPVAAAFALLFALTAVANVGLLLALRRTRRPGSDELPRSPVSPRLR